MKERLKQVKPQQTVSDTPVQMYNVIYTTISGDNILKAQVNNPYSYVEMFYPAAHIFDEHNDNTTWEMDGGDVKIYAVPVRNIALDVLLPTAEFNKIMRQE